MSIWNNVNFMAVWGHPAVPRHKDSTDKKIFEKAGNLPSVEKREKTAFNEFKLSNPESALRRKTLIEYH